VPRYFTYSTHGIVAPFMYILLQCDCGFLPPNVINWLFAGLNLMSQVDANCSQVSEGRSVLVTKAHMGKGL